MKGIIPVDYANKFAPGVTFFGNPCDDVANYQAMLDAGTYVDDASVLNLVGQLAVDAPKDPSPLFDGFTNEQVPLILGASGDDHFVAGVFDQNGIPTGLRYTIRRLWSDVLIAASEYIPIHWELEEARLHCNAVTPPFDDHLKDIILPILYVGAAGATGKFGYYATTLTSSNDVTVFTVQLFPDDQRALDFGHADLFLAGNAQKLVWKPILDWLIEHQ